MSDYFGRVLIVSPVICPPPTYTKFILGLISLSIKLVNITKSVAFIAAHFKDHMLSWTRFLLHDGWKLDDLLGPYGSFRRPSWERLRYGLSHMFLLSVNTSSLNCYVLMLRGLEDELRLLRGVVTSSDDILVLVACERTLLEIAVRSRLRLHPLLSSAIHVWNEWPI